jgi:uncharacterized protein YecE (DUF72 family)
MKAEDRLTFYAEHFDTVEVDSTFYATPSPHTVNEWGLRTPTGLSSRSRCRRSSRMTKS